MFARIAPVAVLASAVVSLHGCGGGGTTTLSPSPSPSPSPGPSPGPSPPGPSLINGTCNAERFPGVEDCDRVDFGSCGNACCEITTTVSLTPEAVATALNASLADGGPDGQYELQHLFENVTGFVSLGDAGFLGQVHHTTSGPGHYTDKVNIHIEPDGDNAKITAFSLALIGGALGDSGQSYKNIIMALKGANLAGWSDASVTNVGGSCPAPAGKTAALAQSAVVEVTQRRRLDLINGTCGLPEGGAPSTVSDCQNVDLGSCGNACCSLTVTLSVSADEAANALNSSFDNGGPDGQFTKNSMAEGVLGIANLTGGPPPEAAAFGFGSGGIFIGQLNHMTTGGKYHFNDTLNFNIVDGEGGATMNAFSTSLIGGAYSDAGQGYKNLMMLLSVFGENATVAPGKFSTSCPAPSSLLV